MLRFSLWFSWMSSLHPSLTCFFFSPSRVVVNASGAPVLWRVNEDGFLRSSILNGTTMWFLQGADGLVVPDHFLPLGQNYFLSKTLCIFNTFKKTVFIISSKNIQVWKGNAVWMCLKPAFCIIASRGRLHWLQTQLRLYGRLREKSPNFSLDLSSQKIFSWQVFFCVNL